MMAEKGFSLHLLHLKFSFPAQNMLEVILKVFFVSYSQNREVQGQRAAAVVASVLFHTDSSEQTLSFLSADGPDTDRRCSTVFLCSVQTGV